MEYRQIQSLLSPGAYPEETVNVELRQTHVSWLMLTERYVYKIKKPVDFGFLNFTTIDRRRFYCHEEVRLNSRLSPEIYLGVVEIRETPDGASFVGSGQVIDHAVKMVRLPSERMLDRLLASRELDRNDLQRIAKKVASFHLNAERSADIDRFGSLESICRNWEENLEQSARMPDRILPADDRMLIQGWVLEFMSANEPLFGERVRKGHICDGDGDLHLQNICLGENVWIFDCIEFNNRFRYGDTAADIAFLLMDLDFHDRPDLGTAFLDEYCRGTGDEECRQLIDFYKVYRAFIRGKVAGLQLGDVAIQGADREAAEQSAKGYFRLARGYILRRQLPPTLILVGGLMGSGKSTLACLTARELGLPQFSSDMLRKELLLGLEQSRSAAPYAEGIYTPEADALTYAELLTRAMRHLADGKSVVVDATFRRSADRHRFRSAAEEAGAAFCLAMTECPAELIRRRLSEREGRTGEISDGRLEIFDQHLAGFEQPVPEDEPCITVTTAGDVWASVDELLRGLGVLP